MNPRQLSNIRARDAVFDRIPSHWQAQSDRRVLLSMLDELLKPKDLIPVNSFVKSPFKGSVRTHIVKETYYISDCGKQRLVTRAKCGQKLFGEPIELNQDTMKCLKCFSRQ